MAPQHTQTLARSERRRSHAAHAAGLDNGAGSPALQGLRE